MQENTYRVHFGVVISRNLIYNHTKQVEYETADCRTEGGTLCTTLEVTEDIVWVGASDRRLALFENIFPIPRGVSYNSYVLLD